MTNIKKLNEKLEQFLEEAKIYTNKEFMEHVKSLLPQELKVIKEEEFSKFWDYKCEITTESDFGQILIGTGASDPKGAEDFNYLFVVLKYKTAGSDSWVNYKHEYWGRGVHNIYAVDSQSNDPNLDQQIKDALNDVISIQKQHAQALKDNDPKTMFQYAIAKDGKVTECVLLKEGSFGQLYRVTILDIYGKKVVYAGIIKDGKAKKIGMGPLLDILEQL